MIELRSGKTDAIEVLDPLWPVVPRLRHPAGRERVSRSWASRGRAPDGVGLPAPQLEFITLAGHRPETRVPRHRAWRRHSAGGKPRKTRVSNPTKPTPWANQPMTRARPPSPPLGTWAKGQHREDERRHAAHIHADTHLAGRPDVQRKPEVTRGSSPAEPSGDDEVAGLLSTRGASPHDAAGAVDEVREDRQGPRAPPAPRPTTGLTGRTSCRATASPCDSRSRRAPCPPRERREQ